MRWRTIEPGRRTTGCSGRRRQVGAPPLIRVFGRPRGHVTKSLALAVATVVTIGTAIAADRPYLAPVDGDLSVLGVAPALQAYHLAARDTLVSNAGDRTWEAVVIPSFEREWAVYVERGGRSGTQVVCTVMQTQLWYQMESGAERASGPSYAERELAALQKADKKIWRYASPIAATTAAALDRLWSALLAHARLSGEPPRCIDGTSYFLFQWAGGMRSRGGWGRCPQKDSPPAAALAVLEDLCKAAGNLETGLLLNEGKLAEEISRIQRSIK